MGDCKKTPEELKKEQALKAWDELWKKDDKKREKALLKKLKKYKYEMKTNPILDKKHRIIKTQDLEIVKEVSPTRLISNENSDELDFELLDIFPDEVFESLPKVLKDACDLFSGARKDVFFLTFIAVVGGSLTNTYTIYKQDKQFTNLYVAVYAPAASGKSSMKWIRKCFNEIDKKIRSDSKPNSNDEEKYMIKTLFIASDITGAMWSKQLSVNENNQGIMFCTEAETLTKSANSKDLGGFNDGLRICSEGETYEVMRKTNNESYVVEYPKLTIVLSGTPDQIYKLIPSAEDGLASRFLYYSFIGESKWEKIANYSELDFESLLNPLTLFVTDQYWSSKSNGGMNVFFNKKQKQKFDKLFDYWSEKYYDKFGDDSLSLIFRLAPRILKIAAILASLRYFNQNRKFADKINCNDCDFDTAILIARVLLAKSMEFLSLMKKKSVARKYNGQKYDLLCHMPDKFSTVEIFKIAEVLGIKMKTAEGYLNTFLNDGLISRVKKGHYNKLFEI